MCNVSGTLIVTKHADSCQCFQYFVVLVLLRKRSVYCDTLGIIVVYVYVVCFVTKTLT